jgi:hypothetical protein
MGAIGINEIAGQVVKSLLVSAAVAIVVVGGCLIASCLSNVILKLTLVWAKRGLPLGAREYMSEWIASWQHELREDLKARDSGRLGTELYVVLRVLTLPRYFKLLREQANRVALAEQPQSVQADQKVMYGRFLGQYGRMDYEINPRTLHMRLSFGDSVLVEVAPDPALPRDLAITALQNTRSALFDAPPRHVDTVLDLLQRDGQIRVLRTVLNPKVIRVIRD